ncbi:dormancy-associated protein-like protein 4 [Cucumis melo var. makuwa]|uniref:Dormancy-associated protein-like protein 4 n=1 Tax=Cucumis melo var. makuwa TaxID=1194695 RepID=A0A5D3D6E1_CUCMM|nr:dormancy-associated protein-like protein 4 [Cucumis melo var. makuwa]TYK19121.1 dormancy-associated protein-like protein 4 [Cucumis melo var. makuwa]
MSFLQKLWDETLAGPAPDSGLSRLRKYNSFSASRSPPMLSNDVLSNNNSNNNIPPTIQIPSPTLSQSPTSFPESPMPAPSTPRTPPSTRYGVGCSAGDAAIRRGSCEETWEKKIGGLSWTPSSGGT